MRHTSFGLKSVVVLLACPSCKMSHYSGDNQCLYTQTQIRVPIPLSDLTTERGFCARLVKSR